MPENPKLIDKWLASLPRDARRAASGVIASADASGTPLYLVGGPLRDLLLDRPSLDIDLVTEGDAIELAQRAARYLDATVKTHPTFGTATIVILRNEESGGEGPTLRPRMTPRPRPSPRSTLTIDIATARTETYPRPGALPRVATSATIDQDLLRRDFTINALALRLNGPDRGALLDPAGGRADLDARLVRTLHPRSFRDDPTRIFRAVRYARRLGFQLEARTRAAIRRNLRHLARVSGARIHAEIARILAEPEPERVLLDLDRLGVLRALHPALRFSAPQARAFADVRTLTTAPGTAYWPLFLWPDSPAAAAAIASRLALTNPQRDAVHAVPSVLLIRRRLSAPNPRPSRIADLLGPFPPATLWALAAMSRGRTRDRLLDYLRRGRHIKPALRGDDLIALGVPRGPAVGDILRRLRAAKLDNEVRTRKQEEALVRRLIPKVASRSS